MAITYQSIQSNNASSGTTVIVTKPVSLAVGDVMIASANSSNNAGISLPSGFTVVRSGTIDGVRSFTTAYKVATAGDVAAADFTFTANSSLGDMSASLLRFSTTLSFPSVPIINSINDYTIGLSSGPVSTHFIDCVFANGSRSSSAQASSPARTWTERYDRAAADNSTSIATAPNTVAETIASFSVTLSGSGNNSNVFMILAEVESPTTNISHLAVSLTLFGVVPSVNVNPHVSHIAITPTINGVNSRLKNPIWIDETKSSSTWVSETK